MKRSTDRVLTTHTGSLPRPEDVLALVRDKESGREAAGYAARVREATAEIVRRQRAVGLDVVNDGELGKPDYSTYIKNRLSGFDGPMEAHPVSRDARDFAAFFASNPTGTASVSRPSCTGPVEWRDFAAVQVDIDNLKAATAASDAADVFMTAVSPGQAARFMGNRYYASHEAYLRALGAALKREYDAIAQAGFVLQVDCPDLASGWNNQFAESTLAQFREVVRLHIDVLNQATRDVPTEQLRLHLCWGNYPGPHNHDIALAEIIGPVLESRAGAISFEGANPRHEHEWKVFKSVKLAPGRVIIPGVLDSTSNFIEHPELVAERIVKYAELVGREHVIAGVDCGFATFAGSPTVHPSIAWAKLAAMAEGARIASQQLWR